MKLRECGSGDEGDEFDECRKGYGGGGEVGGLIDVGLEEVDGGLGVE